MFMTNQEWDRSINEINKVIEKKTRCWRIIVNMTSNYLSLKLTNDKRNSLWFYIRWCRFHHWWCHHTSYVQCDCAVYPFGIMFEFIHVDTCWCLFWDSRLSSRYSNYDSFTKQTRKYVVGTPLFAWSRELSRWILGNLETRSSNFLKRFKFIWSNLQFPIQNNKIFLCSV